MDKQGLYSLTPEAMALQQMSLSMPFVVVEVMLWLFARQSHIKKFMLMTPIFNAWHTHKTMHVCTELHIKLNS